MFFPILLYFKNSYITGRVMCSTFTLCLYQKLTTQYASMKNLIEKFNAPILTNWAYFLEIKFQIVLNIISSVAESRVPKLSVKFLQRIKISANHRVHSFVCVSWKEGNMNNLNYEEWFCFFSILTMSNLI